MKNLKHLPALLLAFAITFVMTATVFAAVEDTGFADVSADAWYADAVIYCRDNSLMGGTDATAFAPEDAMTRAMLATVLYRAAGSPDVTGSDSFTDTADGAWYADAVRWASANGMISGYGDGLFGTDDPVTREQIAAILWRSAGSPAADAGQPFADESRIAAFAATAVDWAQSEGIVSGKDGNRFDPAGRATRAEVATMLMHYTQNGQPTPAPAPTPAPTPAPQEGSAVLIAYFSATGNTENIAQQLGEILDGDLYEIVPQIPYTAADLNYNDPSSRCSQENNDPSVRPAISGGVDRMESYDVIFLGYPKMEYGFNCVSCI